MRAMRWRAAPRVLFACVSIASCGGGAAKDGALAAESDTGAPDPDIESDAAPDPSDAGASSERAFSCGVHAPTMCPVPPPRYSDVAPIIELRCASVCHSGAVDGPWPLNAYQHVADWQDFIRSDMLDCTMPPPDAGVPITIDERLAILTWIRCGLPQ